MARSDIDIIEMLTARRGNFTDNAVVGNVTVSGQDYTVGAAEGSSREVSSPACVRTTTYVQPDFSAWQIPLSLKTCVR